MDDGHITSLNRIGKSAFVRYFCELRQFTNAGAQSGRELLSEMA